VNSVRVSISPDTNLMSTDFAAVVRSRLIAERNVRHESVLRTHTHTRTHARTFSLSLSLSLLGQFPSCKSYSFIGLLFRIPNARFCVRMFSLTEGF
jgi:hypothetical protein